jgi:hypothetical protein
MRRSTSFSRDGRAFFWNGPLDVPVEFLPIVMLKSGVINMRVSGVKNKLQVVLQLEIAHHMKSCVKVSFLQVCQM